MKAACKLAPWACPVLLWLCGAVQAQDAPALPAGAVIPTEASPMAAETPTESAAAPLQPGVELPDPAGEPTADAPGPIARGVASWYGDRFHGRPTANGERFDMHALTAAHPTLPFGSIVRVRSLVNDRVVDVRINDRGPYTAGRIIDLSRAAAAVLGLIQSGAGTKPVQLKVLQDGLSETVGRSRRLVNVRRSSPPPAR